ncbi:MAG: DUF512 domain-containing protein [Dehalococcoidia bacterium]|nr:DUF512 domain-containing protein [Dehalococcoidia bacterium]
MASIILEGDGPVHGSRGPRRCRNRCFFCYVTGLPAGLRRTLYLRDDDPLHSFLFGNFVTLTNLSERDWRLLESRRLSPLRVSVHATDLDLRRRMLGNSQAPDILEQLGRLVRLGIHVHAQVVLCPGVNDGAFLEKTVHDLARLGSMVESVAVVPVGLSRPLEEKLASRPGPWPLARFTPDQCRALLGWAISRQEGFRNSFGRTFLHMADEFYLLAEHPIPEAGSYDGFPQYQNGIGMVRTLLDDWVRLEARTRRRLEEGKLVRPERLIILSGKLIAPLIKDLGRGFASIINRDLIVVPVENRLFGARVTVSGLISGRDYLEALPALSAGDLVLTPRRALESSGRLFLDSLSLRKFRRLAMPARVALVDRPGDLDRVIWQKRDSSANERPLCAA